MVCRPLVDCRAARLWWVNGQIGARWECRTKRLFPLSVDGRGEESAGPFSCALDDAPAVAGHLPRWRFNVNSIRIGKPWRNYGYLRFPDGCRPGVARA